MRPSTAEGWYVLSIIAVSFRRFRGRKPATPTLSTAHERMDPNEAVLRRFQYTVGSARSVLRHPEALPGLFGRGASKDERPRRCDTRARGTIAAVALRGSPAEEAGERLRGCESFVRLGG